MGTSQSGASSGLAAFWRKGLGALTLASAALGLCYMDHMIDVKLAEVDARLSAKMEVLKETVSKTVATKFAVLKECCNNEVGGKTAKMAGLTNTVDAKMAGISDMARAEVRIVLKDYIVSGDRGSRQCGRCSRQCYM